MLTVVENKEIPLRHVPGLSLNSYQEPLEQLGMFTDGDNMAVITKKAEHRDQLAYLDQVSSAVGYHLGKPDHVLVLGAGGGADILQAQYHGVPSIDAVELNPQLSDLVRNRYAAYAGNVFGNTETRLYNDEIRGFVRKSKQQYDLIQLALTDGFNGSTAGVYALSESYLYTVEALQDYILRLAPDGCLAITRWVKMPPRDTLKLFATAVEGLRGLGIKEVEKRLVLIRSWQTSTLLIKYGQFTKSDLLAIQNFCKARSFDIAYLPGVEKKQVNLHNILPRPLFYLAAQSLLGKQADKFIDDYKFNIKPATDDQPFFHHFFKWSSFPEILRLRQQGSAPLLESGYLVLVVTLAVACMVSVVLILLPLSFIQKKTVLQSYEIRKIHVLFYFFLIGAAFLFIEMAFLQKFILFLHHPVFAISTGLASFLVFAGLGSYWSQTVSNMFTVKKGMKLVVVSLGGFCVLYMFVLDYLFTYFGDSSLSLRIAVSVALIAPLATLMGMPFPLYLKKLVDGAEQFVPWAWGINGCASVISATLATFLAIQFGFNLLILTAVFLYLSAWAVSVSSG